MGGQTETGAGDVGGGVLSGGTINNSLNKGMNAAKNIRHRHVKKTPSQNNICHEQVLKMLQIFVLFLSLNIIIKFSIKIF